MQPPKSPGRGLTLTLLTPSPVLRTDEGEPYYKRNLFDPPAFGIPP
jgi:hypothetical protein